MSAYDDTETIKAIKRAMEIDPSLSQRAAIIRVAGEGSLRRIEIKMKAARSDHRQLQDAPIVREIVRFYNEVYDNPGVEVEVLEGSVSSVETDCIWVKNDAGSITRVSFPMDEKPAPGALVRLYRIPGKGNAALLNLASGSAVPLLPRPHLGLLLPYVSLLPLLVAGVGLGLTQNTTWLAAIALVPIPILLEIWIDRGLQAKHRHATSAIAGFVAQG